MIEAESEHFRSDEGSDEVAEEASDSNRETGSAVLGQRVGELNQLVHVFQIDESQIDLSRFADLLSNVEDVLAAEPPSGPKPAETFEGFDWATLWEALLIDVPITLEAIGDRPNSEDSILASPSEMHARALLVAGNHSKAATAALVVLARKLCAEYSTGRWAPQIVLGRLARPVWIALCGVGGCTTRTTPKAKRRRSEKNPFDLPAVEDLIVKSLKAVSLAWEDASNSVRAKLAEQFLQLHCVATSNGKGSRALEILKRLALAGDANLAEMSARVCRASNSKESLAVCQEVLFHFLPEACQVPPRILAWLVNVCEFLLRTWTTHDSADEQKAVAGAYAQAVGRLAKRSLDATVRMLRDTELVSLLGLVDKLTSDSDARDLAAETVAPSLVRTVETAKPIDESKVRDAAIALVKLAHLLDDAQCETVLLQIVTAANKANVAATKVNLLRLARDFMRRASITGSSQCAELINKMVVSESHSEAREFAARLQAQQWVLNPAELVPAGQVLWQTLPAPSRSHALLELAEGLRRRGNAELKELQADELKNWLVGELGSARQKPILIEHALRCWLLCAQLHPATLLQETSLLASAHQHVLSTAAGMSENGSPTLHRQEVSLKLLAELLHREESLSPEADKWTVKSTICRPAATAGEDFYVATISWLLKILDSSRRSTQSTALDNRWQRALLHGVFDGLPVAQTLRLLRAVAAVATTRLPVAAAHTPNVVFTRPAQLRRLWTLLISGAATQAVQTNQLLAERLGADEFHAAVFIACHPTFGSRQTKPHTFVSREMAHGTKRFPSAWSLPAPSDWMIDAIKFLLADLQSDHPFRPAVLEYFRWLDWAKLKELGSTESVSALNEFAKTLVEDVLVGGLADWRRLKHSTDVDSLPGAGSGASPVAPASSPAGPGVKPSVTPTKPSVATAKAPVKPKPTVKMTAAQQRLLSQVAKPKAAVLGADSSAPPSTTPATGTPGPQSSTPAASAATTQELEAIPAHLVDAAFVAKLECLRATVQHWPSSIIACIPVLNERVRGIFGTGSAAVLAAHVLLKELVNTFVDRDTVAERRLIPRCLFNMSLAAVNKDASLQAVISADAEAICSSLSEAHPLDASGSEFVLPVILRLLTAGKERDVPFVAIHRSLSVLDNQLRLGASLNPVTVLECARAVAGTGRSLLPLLTSILGSVPRLIVAQNIPMSTAQFIGEEISSLAESDDMRFRRAVLEVMTYLPIEHLQRDATLARVFAVARGDNDPETQAFAAGLMDEEAHKAWLEQRRKDATVFIRLFVPLIASKSAMFRRGAARALAAEFSDCPVLLIDQLSAAYVADFDHRQAAAPSFAARMAAQGFRLKDEDLARLQAAEAAKNQQVDTTPWHLGRFGVATVIRALLTTTSASGGGRGGGGPTRMSWDGCEAVLKFLTKTIFPDQTARWVDPHLLDDAQDLGLLFATANIQEARRAVDFLIAEIPNIKANGPTGAGSAALAVACVTLGNQTKGLSNESPAIQKTFELLNAQLMSAASPLMVKQAIGRALHPLPTALIAAGTKSADDLLEFYWKSAMESKDVQLRVGAALGLGALVRSQGVAFVESSNVIDKLSVEAAARQPHTRHGALICFEAIIRSIGRGIEPYANQILPVLLSGLADMQPTVREAAGLVAKKLMGTLGPAGLKAVLPEIIRYAADPSWRTKVGSLELLANVGAVSPQHVSTSILQVLPVILDSIHDSHKEVKAMAVSAMSTLMAVVANPEIKSVQDQLIAALVDPADAKNLAFLDTLVTISFTHYLDQCALAFLEPVLARGLKGHRSEVRVRATQTVAVLCRVCRHPEETLTPFIVDLLPGLQICLADPLPEVRRTAARCFGLLARDLGESLQRQVLPWLIKTLKASNSSVERSGVANALAESLHSMGKQTFGTYLPDLLRNARSNPNPGMRKAFLGLFVYVPLVFKREELEEFVPSILPVLLQALASEDEQIRDVAYRGTQIFVSQYGSSHTPLLLQPLEQSQFHEAVEVRMRAVQLLGALVDKILKGASDSNLEGGQQMQLEILSLERRVYILSAVYLARSDDDIEVRHAAVQVWKSVVQNTPRTVKELLPILTRRIISLLGSGDPIKEGCASRCLTDLVTKHGDRLLPEFMNIFLESLTKSQAATEAAEMGTGGTAVDQTSSANVAETRGIFIGLEAVLRTASRTQLKAYAPQLTPLLLKALKQTKDDESRKRTVEVTEMLSAAAAAPEPFVTAGGRKGAAKVVAKRDTKRKAAESAKQFLGPLLDDYLEPASFTSDQFSDERLGLLKTVTMFIETKRQQEGGAGDALEEIVARCSADTPHGVDLAKVWLLGSLAACGTKLLRLNLSRILGLLNAAYHSIVERAATFGIEDAEPHPLQNSATAAAFRSEIQQSIAQLLESLTWEFQEELQEYADLCFDKGATPRQVSATTWKTEAAEFDLSQARVADISTLRAALAGVENTPEERAAGLSRASMRGFGILCWMAMTQDTLLDTARIEALLKLAVAELDDVVRETAAQALGQLMAKMPKEKKAEMGAPFKSVLLSLLADPDRRDDETLFESPRVVLPITRSTFEIIQATLHAGLLTGSIAAREAAAEALRYVVLSTEEATLAATAVKATGPLIRVFAERVPASVKTKVMATLIAILDATGTATKPLVPQLQSTFIRCLLDPASSETRDLAAEALGKLASMAGPRVDLLVRELAKSMVESAVVRPNILQALARVYQVASGDIQPATRQLLWQNCVALSTPGGASPVLSAKEVEYCSEVMTSILIADGPKGLYQSAVGQALKNAAVRKACDRAAAEW